jgi:hypothetical protein
MQRLTSAPRNLRHRLLATAIAVVAVLALNVRGNGPASAIQTGDVTAAVAAKNRATIDTGASLPAGIIQTDQAVMLKSGQTLDGNGQTTLRNTFRGDRFGENCTLHGHGSGAGYSDTVTVLTPPTRVQLADSAAAAYYHPGGLAYFFRYDGYIPQKYGDGLGQLALRRTIQAKSDTTLTLSAAVDRRVDRAKWFTAAAPIAADVKVGQTAVSVATAEQAKQFAPGDHVLITEGPSVANEQRDEWHRVVAVNSQSIQLQWPARRAYRAAAIAKMQPPTGVTVKNITLDVPVNTATSTAFFKYAVGWRLENVTINGNLALGGCANCILVNCTISEVGLNSCHGITLINCTIGRLALEESCFDIVASGCTFGPAPVPLQCSVFCEKLAFHSCKVTGGSNMPVSIGGPDMLFDDFVIEATPRPLNAYFSGDRLRVSRLKSDCAVVIYGGSGIVAQGVSAPTTYLGWTDGSRSSGEVTDIANPQIKQGAWRPLRAAAKR